MVSWDQAKGKQASGNQNKLREIERLSMSIGDTKVRLVGEVMPRYCYWVVTTEGKKMPVECLQFNRQTESFDNSAQDPFKEIDEAIFADKVVLPTPVNPATKIREEVFNFSLLENTNLFDNWL